MEKLLVSTEERRGKRSALNWALRRALDRGHVKNFRLILQSNILDLRALTESVHHAIRSDSAPYHQEFVQSLLDLGASADTITEDRYHGPQTSFLVAINPSNRGGDPRCVRIILEIRARTNKELGPETAYTPLQLAAHKGNLKIVRMFLNHRQDPDSIWPYSDELYWR